MDFSNILDPSEFSKFTHYSSVSNLDKTFDTKRKYDVKTDFVPDGMFFAIGSAWIDWTIRERFRCAEYRYRYTIHSSSFKKLNILKIDDIKYYKKIDNDDLYGLDWGDYYGHYDGVYITQKILDQRWDFSVLSSINIAIGHLDIPQMIVWNVRNLKLVRCLL